MGLHEASAYLGVPQAQLLRWAGNGVGPKHIGNPLVPKSMRYESRELDRWKNGRGTTERLHARTG